MFDGFFNVKIQMVMEWAEGRW